MGPKVRSGAQRKANVKFEDGSESDGSTASSPGSETIAKSKSKSKSKARIKAELASDSDVDIKSEPQADEEDNTKIKTQSKARSKSNAKPKSEPESDLLQVPSPPLNTPALSDAHINYSYEIARGEIGVLSFEPYKSLVLPYWRFRTVPIARNSSKVLFQIFLSYVKRGDLPGADMTRKFIQMGMTRAKRYANHKGGRKYGADGKVLEKWSGHDVDGKRREKEMASEVFKGYWRKCIEDEQYADLKAEWTKAKKEYWKQKGTKPPGIYQSAKKEEEGG